MQTNQLHLLRCLSRQSLPAELLDIFLQRCGADQAGYDELVSLGAVQQRQGRVEMTDAGRKLYRKEKVGRYF